MRGLPDTASKQSTSYNTAASGNDSIVTIAAPTDGYNVIDWVIWSYDATPTSGSVTVTDSTNNTTLAKWSITTDGPGGTFFSERGMVTPQNTITTFTLADGGAGKHLTVQYR